MDQKKDNQEMQNDKLRARIERLEAELVGVHERNRRVEADKAWETSVGRAVSIAVLTYSVALLVFWSMHVERPYLSAIIPTVGFILSIQSLPLVRSYWDKSRSANKEDRATRRTKRR